jgi:dolichol-phosphate mannosyltransferase
MKHLSNIKKIFYKFVIIITIKKELNLKKFIEEVLKIVKKQNLIILFFDKRLDKETFFLANKIAKKNKNVIVKYDRSVKNLADAYFKAYKFSSSINCKWIISMNAGWRHKPSDIKKFMKFYDSDFCCIWGYRDITSNKATKTRKLISYLGNFLSYIILSIKMKDLTSGFYMIKKEILKKIFFKNKSFISKGHFIDTELKFYLKNYKFTQVKIQYNSPNKKLPLKNILDSLRSLLIIFFRRFNKKY